MIESEPPLPATEAVCDATPVLMLRPSTSAQNSPSSSTSPLPRPATAGQSLHPLRDHCRDISPMQLHQHTITGTRSSSPPVEDLPATCYPSCSATPRNSSPQVSRSHASPHRRACSLCFARPSGPEPCESWAGLPCTAYARRRGIEGRCAVKEGNNQHMSVNQTHFV